MNRPRAAARRLMELVYTSTEILTTHISDQIHQDITHISNLSVV
jgi:hypothetical protein